MSGAELPEPERKPIAIECESCAGLFNPKRPTILPHYNANRCSHCGHEHTPLHVRNKMSERSLNTSWDGQKLYLMSNGDFIKIGISKNPEKRANQIQTGNPKQVKVVKTWQTENPLETEKAIHAKLFDNAARGEWFEMDKDSLNGVINAISLFI